MGKGGRFPTVTKAEVQKLAEAERRKELEQQIQANAFNAQGLRGKTRTHPLGTLQVSKDEFPGTQGLEQSRQYYDPRYNVWACKFLISYWGRNAYGTGGSGDSGSTPILVDVPSVGQCKVWCHIDITTPREDFLWHGAVEGPHIVVDSYQTETGQPQRGGEAIWLSPQDVYKLALHQYGCAQRGVAAGNEWPHEITGKLAAVISDKQETIRRKANRASTASDDDEPLGNLWC